MHTLVIARYAEELEWIAQVPSNFEIFVYNKGEEITSPQVLERANHIIARPNVGRESETYLHHMMGQRQRDHHFTVFAQGDPFTHSPDFIQLLNNWTDWEKIQTLSWAWVEEKNVPPQKFLDAYRPKLRGGPRVREEYFSLYTWGPVDFIDNGALGMGTVYRLLNGGMEAYINIAAHMLRRCRMDHIAEEAEKHLLGTFSYGAIFAVRNDLVTAVSPDSYARLYDFATAPVVAHGYILERMWLHFFGAPFTLRRL
ncbi:hypothetical protein GOZ90_00230 [Agrobacterium vitis]|uniref:Glycosyltransferase n=1 Tax=Agrobacterium vitis TaxID=373 RepID=A0A1S2DNR0_AGRVI|nr:hypothetical protein [Agrobacterium vitis]MCE6074828.1 hypothetical protein [Agrobacterium vitis]MCM2451058.1 hypothetical protein [Agrobacterium vitis]MCM2467767.1 hypothetical protein [Agrobacterium vitis]MUO68328.1 hypothetical protein [Agrobacterium vitis]MUO83454.1 hypothetical protein [Agrobacterium vitis]